MKKTGKKPSQDSGMNASERKAASTLAGIYSLRMFGLFMILPVFALYAEHLEGHTPFLVGLAIGIYGLTQALLQIPFGMLSDRIGRKPVIAAGLVIFAIGSIVAANADSMLGVIIGRAIQGSGAIAAAIMALTADLTREENRVKAMAMIGISIGVAFAVSMVAGPVIDRWIGVDGMFWLTAGLALAAIVVLLVVVPTPAASNFHRDMEPVRSQFKSVLSNSELVRLDIGIFILHMVLTASFTVLPLVLRDHVGLPSIHHWWIYLPVMVLAMGLMVPFVIVAESKRRMKQIMTGAVFVLALSEFLMMGNIDSGLAMFLSLLLFFIAFNVMEATLPSLVAKTAPPHYKGTAMGVYSTSQFTGAFVGGALGGYLHGAHGLQSVFLFCGMGLTFWLFLVATMKNPKYLSSFVVRVGPVTAERAQHLVNEMTRVTGVAEAIVIPEDGVAYLKIDNHAINKDELLKFRYDGD